VYRRFWIFSVLIFSLPGQPVTSRREEVREETYVFIVISAENDRLPLPFPTESDRERCSQSLAVYLPNDNK
jgi:hypothetical protein